MEELKQLSGGEEKKIPESSPSMKDEILSALQEMRNQERKELEEQQQTENLKKIHQQKAIEDEEVRRVNQELQETCQEVVQKDPDFKKVLADDNLPGNILESLHKIGKIEYAPLVVRELAANEEYQEKLKRIDTKLGRDRFISKMALEIAEGSRQGPSTVHPMMQANIPHINPNSNYSQTEDMYEELASSIING